MQIISLSANNNHSSCRLHLFSHTHPCLKVEFTNDTFEYLLCGSPQCRRVEVVQLVEAQQLGQVLEGLVADAVHELIRSRRRNPVDDVVTDFGVLAARERGIKRGPGPLGGGRGTYRTHNT